MQANVIKRGNEDKVRSLMKVRMRIILLLTLFAAYDSLAVSIGITSLVYGEVPTHIVHVDVYIYLCRSKSQNNPEHLKTTRQSPKKKYPEQYYRLSIEHPARFKSNRESVG